MRDRVLTLLKEMVQKDDEVEGRAIEESKDDVNRMIIYSTL